MDLMMIDSQLRAEYVKNRLTDRLPNPLRDVCCESKSHEYEIIVKWIR